MKIIVLRHGDAGRSLSDPARDAGRGLTSEGRDAVGAVLDRFDAENLRPRRIIASPLARSAETAELAAKKFGLMVETSEALLPGKDLAPFVERLRADKTMRRVMLAVHHDNIEPVLANDFGDTDKLAKGELRVYRIKRNGTKAKRLDRIAPSDAGYEDSY